ncbi:MAG: hypothetical protein AB1679_23350 [Actinomycetota bacterium]
MADVAQHHHWHELPLRRRVLRFVLVSILLVTGVMLLQSVVMYLTMPKVTKATHHARAACASLGTWLDGGGPTGTPEAAPSLTEATESARSAAAMAPERWSALLEDLQSAAGPDTPVNGPGPVLTPRGRAIASAMATCDSVLGKRVARAS